MLVKSRRPLRDVKTRLPTLNEVVIAPEISGPALVRPQCQEEPQPRINEKRRRTDRGVMGRPDFVSTRICDPSTGRDAWRPGALYLVGMNRFVSCLMSCSAMAARCRERALIRASLQTEPRFATFRPITRTQSAAKGPKVTITRRTTFLSDGSNSSYVSMVEESDDSPSLSAFENDRYRLIKKREENWLAEAQLTIDEHARCSSKKNAFQIDAIPKLDLECIQLSRSGLYRHDVIQSSPKQGIRRRDSLKQSVACELKIDQSRDGVRHLEHQQLSATEKLRPTATELDGWLISKFETTRFESRSPTTAHEAKTPQVPNPLGKMTTHRLDRGSYYGPRPNQRRIYDPTPAEAYRAIILRGLCGSPRERMDGLINISLPNFQRNFVTYTSSDLITSSLIFRPKNEVPRAMVTPRLMPLRGCDYESAKFYRMRDFERLLVCDWHILRKLPDAWGDFFSKTAIGERVPSLRPDRFYRLDVRIGIESIATPLTFARIYGMGQRPPAAWQREAFHYQRPHEPKYEKKWQRCAERRNVVILVDIAVPWEPYVRSRFEALDGSDLENLLWMNYSAEGSYTHVPKLAHASRHYSPNGGGILFKKAVVIAGRSELGLVLGLHGKNILKPMYRGGASPANFLYCLREDSYRSRRVEEEFERLFSRDYIRFKIQFIRTELLINGLLRSVNLPRPPHCIVYALSEVVVSAEDLRWAWRYLRLFTDKANGAMRGLTSLQRAGWYDVFVQLLTLNKELWMYSRMARKVYLRMRDDDGPEVKFSFSRAYRSSVNRYWTAPDWTAPVQTANEELRRYRRCTISYRDWRKMRDNIMRTMVMSDTVLEYQNVDQCIDMLDSPRLRPRLLEIPEVQANQELVRLIHLLAPQKYGAEGKPSKKTRKAKFTPRVKENVRRMLLDAVGTNFRDEHLTRTAWHEHVLLCLDTLAKKLKYSFMDYDIQWPYVVDAFLHKRMGYNPELFRVPERYRYQRAERNWADFGNVTMKGHMRLQRILTKAATKKTPTGQHAQLEAWQLLVYRRVMDLTVVFHGVCEHTESSLYKTWTPPYRSPDLSNMCKEYKRQSFQNLIAANQALFGFLVMRTHVRPIFSFLPTPTFNPAHYDGKQNQMKRGKFLRRPRPYLPPSSSPEPKILFFTKLEGATREAMMMHSSSSESMATGIT